MWFEGFVFWVGVSLYSLLVVRGLVVRGEEFEFPFSLGVISLFWVVPQQYALLGNISLPLDSLVRQMLMSIFCVLSASVGWYGFQKNYAASTRDARTRDFRIHILVGYTLLGLIVRWRFGIWMDAEGDPMSEGQMHGFGTILLFFSSVTMIAFALSLYWYLSDRLWAYLAICCVNACILADRVILHGRRSDAASVVVVVGVGFWLIRGCRINSIFVALGIFVGVLFVSNTHEYRLFFLGDGVSSIFDIDFLGNFIQFFKGGKDLWTLEIRNSSMLMAAVDLTDGYDFGMSFWNDLVYAFVPGQIIGQGLKESLMFGDGWMECLRKAYGYVPHTGTTPTGAATAYGSFGYLGCFEFFIISIALRRFYERARVGNITSLVLYAILMVQGMHMITHQVTYFTNALVRCAVFLLPVYLWVDRGFRQLHSVGRKGGAI